MIAPQAYPQLTRPKNMLNPYSSGMLTKGLIFMNKSLPPFETVHKNIVVAVILSFITFGLYNIYWQSCQIKIWNQLLGFEKFNFWKWLLLSIITFGIYHIYHEYVMGKDFNLIQSQLGVPVSSELPLLSMALSIFGFFIVADAVQQYELHRLYKSTSY